ncbi:MAG: uracil-DNA glycosylase family protein [Ignavibacteriales bacterium]|jgi:Uracil-DNA glycosylase|nr:MAG: uracil-DNA glycosylase family protein [Ignavibacteriaceae bacterium]MBW7872679.1 uracil-DNA glycosylase family protein [Ignavibacteria bacterium]MCZ2143400.1 uracil-DNA glycosylase family protein [Ignavibacteriales bacterium]OQY74088.1 MAG: IclR family transcriptional regulator [Ignavibacteriales bacterium UTCHB3]MBV6444279.1 hypothetical protein [Ignavibacteriaceae bacterium]
MDDLLKRIAACVVCKEHLPFPPKPVVAISAESKILIIGQAPGIKAHNSGVPWNDVSGDELRRWLGVTREQFYDTKIFTIMPMGFCYPGRGKSGDLPPRPECAPLWHPQVMEYLKNLKLTLLIGSYAINYYINRKPKTSVSEVVKDFEGYLPRFFPLVHPSPRNRKWQRDNPWFLEKVIPELQKQVKKITGR